MRLLKKKRVGMNLTPTFMYTVLFFFTLKCHGETDDKEKGGGEERNAADSDKGKEMKRKTVIH